VAVLFSFVIFYLLYLCLHCVISGHEIKIVVVVVVVVVGVVVNKLYSNV